MADETPVNDAQADIQVDTTESSGPQQVRITNHGRMNAWVTFALDFLDKHDTRPLVIHTLPPPRKDEPKPTTNAAGAQPEGATDPFPTQGREQSRLSTATTTIPRLISVVEIIKREYIKNLELKHSTKILGLHQYNEIGALEDIGLGDPETTPEGNEESRSASIAMALDGKNYPKQKQTPFMRITLSHCELPDLVANGATYQPPLQRKLSKSAKARVNKRKRKEGAESADANLPDAPEG